MSRPANAPTAAPDQPMAAVQGSSEASVIPGPIHSPLRVRVFLESVVVDGMAKPVLEFTRQAASLSPGHPALEISLALFSRSRELDVRFTQAVCESGVPLTIMRERHAFDFAVIPQMRSAVLQAQPDVLWTNN